MAKSKTSNEKEPVNRTLKDAIMMPVTAEEKAVIKEIAWRNRISMAQYLRNNILNDYYEDIRKEMQSQAS